MTNRLNELGQYALPLFAGLIVLFVADRLLQPVPVPAATAVFGGLIGFWYSRNARWLRSGLGVVAGLVIGEGYHLYIHKTGQSPPPQEGMLAHLGVDGAIGLAVALLVLLVGALAYRLLVNDHRHAN